MEELDRVCSWTHGGYFMEAVHMDAKIWLNINRPRTVISLNHLLQLRIFHCLPAQLHKS